jgi:hypothetical protein
MAYSKKYCKKSPNKKHSWRYMGGEAKCIYCHLFIQPDGKVTRTATGRTYKKRKKVKR